jgi:hypothetical protein
MPLTQQFGIGLVVSWRVLLSPPLRVVTAISAGIAGGAALGAPGGLVADQNGLCAADGFQGLEQHGQAFFPGASAFEVGF